jgi:hypothetical protein
MKLDLATPAGVKILAGRLNVSDEQITMAMNIVGDNETQIRQFLERKGFISSRSMKSKPITPRRF